MIMVAYATPGVFLIMAAKDLLANTCLIRFSIWSSIVHGGILFLRVLTGNTERAHLLGDVPALFHVAIILGYLMPGRKRAQKQEPI
jgi:hypothetical protein